MRAAFDIERLIREALETGEEVVWQDAPIPRLVKRSQRALFWFGVVWTSFISVWTCGAAGFLAAAEPEPINFVFPLFSIPFWIIGAFLLSMPRRAARKALATRYVLTDRRAMIVEGGKKQRIRSWPIHRMEEIDVETTEGSAGNVHFAWKGGGENALTREGFIGVAQALEVGKKLRGLQNGGAA